MTEIIGFAQIAMDVPHFDDVTAFIDGNWQPHFNKNDYEGNWEVLTLRSPGGNPDRIYADLMGQTQFADTPYMEMVTSVKALVASLHCPILSVRLLNLKAGAIIKQHRDAELAFEKGAARLHFPILTNDRVEFYVNNILVNMQPGTCWYINANMPHRVANYGTTDRIHLVIDCEVNQWLKDVFARSEKATFKQAINIEQTQQMIDALRLHQTETSNKMADELELQLIAAVNT